LERKERKSILHAALTGFAAAVIALGGNWMLFESGKQERQLKLLAIRAKHLAGMQGNYETQKHTIRLVAALYGMKTAVELEGPFRSGATIRALEELREVDSSDEDRDLVELALASAKRVLVIDSHQPDNIYCDFTKEISGTNVDDIAELVKLFPIRIAGRIGDKIGPDRLQKEIKSKEHPPDVIVMHMDSFEGVKQVETDAENSFEGVKQAETDAEKVGKFLIDIFGPDYKPQVIIYSRDGLSELKKIEEYLNCKNHKDICERMIFLEMEFECFQSGDNAKRITAAIRRAVQLDRLYTRPIS
jgi:hypothetical protein